MLINQNIHRALHQEEQKNERLAAQNARLEADLYYLAMMAEVSLEEEKENADA